MQLIFEYNPVIFHENGHSSNVSAPVTVAGRASLTILRNRISVAFALPPESSGAARRGPLFPAGKLALKLQENAGWLKSPSKKPTDPKL